MITREADYAMRAVVYLSSKQDEAGHVSTIDLSEQMGIPYRFLRKIIKTLVGCKIVLSKRGKGGGLSLSRPAEEISLYDVMTAVDPRGVAINYCMKEGNICGRECSCKMFTELTDLQQSVATRLKSVTFDKLI